MNEGRPGGRSSLQTPFSRSPLLRYLTVNRRKILNRKTARIEAKLNKF
jgi:hypothetical protein